MAERIKDQIIEEERLVDIVVGPDAYRDIPRLIEEVEDGRKAVNVLLSLEETADIAPVRTTGNGVSAFVSIMRGCDNMCSFCVVPFTRGREQKSPLRKYTHQEILTTFRSRLQGSNVIGAKCEFLQRWYPYLQYHLADRAPSQMQLRFRFSLHPIFRTNYLAHS